MHNLLLLELFHDKLAGERLKLQLSLSWTLRLWAFLKPLSTFGAHNSLASFTFSQIKWHPLALGTQQAREQLLDMLVRTVYDILWHVDALTLLRQRLEVLLGGRKPDP